MPKMGWGQARTEDEPARGSSASSCWRVAGAVFGVWLGSCVHVYMAYGSKSNKRRGRGKHNNGGGSASAENKNSFLSQFAPKINNTTIIFAGGYPDWP